MTGFIYSRVKAIGWLLCVFTFVAQTAHAGRHGYQPPKHLALVIGISAYKNWPVLSDAAADAKRVAELLEAGGFSTQLVVDPDGGTLTKAWSTFLKQAGSRPDSACLVYYRGHAKTVVDPNGDRNGWLIAADAAPEDASPEAPPHALQVKALFDDAEKSNLRHVLFLFDTHLTDERLAETQPLLSMPGEADGKPARQVIIAGNDLDGPLSDPSLYTAALIRALTGEADTIRDGCISGSELAVYLANQVAGASRGRQRPRYGRFGNGTERSGDFVFETITPTRRTARLFVNTSPKNARIRILNIKPKFFQGIPLDPGRYHLEVSADGHRQHKAWVEIESAADTTIAVHLKKRATIFENALGMVFRYVPPGQFQMGPLASAANAPMETGYRVTLTRPFYILTSEVTVGQFRRFIAASGYRSQAENAGGCWTSADGRRWRKQPQTNWQTLADTWPASGASAASLPVSCVTWQDARAFAAWLSETDGRTYRLPTEAQWEYACRAGTTTAFAFGDCLTMETANYDPSGITPPACPGETRPARRHPVAVDLLGTNAWGLHHMHGNVAEWCADFYAPYPQRSMRDPHGPATGVERVIRGGHFLSRMGDCRSAKRSSFPPAYASSAVGFRLVALSD